MTKNNIFKLNLVSVLHAVLLFGFFPLLASNLISFQEITGFISLGNERAKTELTLRIEEKVLTLSGASGNIRTFQRSELKALGNTLKELKVQNASSAVINLDPKTDLTYEDLIKIMDSLKDFQIHFADLKA